MYFHLPKTLLISLVAFLLPTSVLAQEFGAPPGGVADSFFDVFYEIDIGPAQPQAADSFFDVFFDIDVTPDFQADKFLDITYEIEIPDLLLCNPCDVLKAELEEVREDKRDAEEGLQNAKRQLQDAKTNLKEAQGELRDAQQLLNDLTNPSSWVESEGRRIDTSDLRVMESYNAELWGQYQAGGLTADEYQQKLRDGLTDAEREARKQKMIKDLKKDVDEFKEEVEDAEDDVEDWQEEIDELEEEIEEINKEIQELMRKLQDCIKRCAAGPVNLVEDYGMGQAPPKGWFQRFLDGIFGGEETPPQDTPADDLRLPPPDLPPTPFPSGFLGHPLVLPTGPLVAGPDIVLPPFPLIFPECNECDELLQLIKEVENELVEIAKDLDELTIELFGAQLAAHTAELARDEAKRNLDNFDNPRSWAESDGRRIDSTDLDIIRTHNRDLWQQYRNGDLTAQELEQRWGEGLSDEERERLKEKRKKELKQELADAEADLDEANEDVDAPERILTDVKKATDELLKELKELEKEYEKCLKKCAEKKELRIGGLDVFPDPPIFLDGAVCQSKIGESPHFNCFESGDRYCHRLTCTPPPKRVTFGDGVIIRPGESVDVNDLLRQSDQYDPQTGTLDLGGEKYKYDDQGNLIISNIGSSGEDGVSVDLPSPIDDKGFFCGTFGLFCPNETDVPLTLEGVVDCLEGGSTDTICRRLDTNNDGELTPVDIELVSLSLQSTEPITVDLNINGMDGNDGLSLFDVNVLGDCLGGDAPSCGRMDIDLDINGPPNPLLGPGDFDLSIGLPGGDDLILGDPLDDLINVNGVESFADDPIPAGFFGPGSDPFGGEIQLSGGPGEDGIDLLYFGTTDRTVGLEWPDNDPPPPPRVPEPSQQPSEEVPQAVRDVIARIIRDNPLGPCEQLIIRVQRIRIGNKVTFTVTATRTRDPEACPPLCQKDGGYSSMEECRSSCSNPDTCAYDGEVCWECDDHQACQIDGGFSSMESCRAGCSNPDTCGYDGGLCWLCDNSDDEQDLCEDLDCDDGDECTEGDCTYAEENYDCAGNCTAGEDCAGVCGGDSYVDECGECGGDNSSPKCPDLAYPDEPSCKAQCTQGECGYRLLGDPGKEFGCFFCVPKEFETPPREDCDSPYLERAACNNSCDGTCEKAYTRDNGEGCYQCKLQCQDGTQTEQNCKASCEGTCVKEYTRGDGVKCFECISTATVTDDPPQCPSGSVSSCSECSGATTCETLNDSCFICEPVVDDGPTCPSGTTSDGGTCESQCSAQGGTCVEENGCYSCVVFNCPSGTTKNECPSNCSSGCNVVGEQGDVKCYQCKQSCEDICSGLGLDVAQDYTSYILGELNGHTCVSGAGISVQQASSGDCDCLSVPQITVDTTPPICAGTPCGDVACGQQASCSGGENTTITVTCNWGGWKQIDEFRFQPVVGQ
jgi:uncharacterized coiled-coil DUF342 family protein